MLIDIVGEDPVTRAIIIRLVKEFRPDMSIGTEHPARGTQLRSLAPMFNSLGSPVFLLTDLDACACAPLLIEQWFGDEPISPELLFRVAYDEAEAWLMADREGFAGWLGIDESLIPVSEIIDKRRDINELRFPCKASLYMMMQLASKSPRADLRDGLTPKLRAGKGPAYNATLLPFIRDIWNIDNAASNSHSLSKAIQRLQEFPAQM